MAKPFYTLLDLASDASADDIKRAGRATQGVIVMRLRGDEQVSALAPVVDSDEESLQDAVVVE